MIIANFKGDRKLSYSEIEMKKRNFSVANSWDSLKPME